MVDRAIGVVGIALAIIAAVLPYLVPKAPPWATGLAFCIGVFLLGISLGLVAAGGRRRRLAPVRSASLRLHVYGDHRTPERLHAENVFRWFYLQQAVTGVGPAGHVQLASFSTLFLSFEPEVVITTLTVRSPDMHLPVYEVKDFNQRYAIIMFSDNVPAGTLEIAVAP